jgi:SAM-dependent methyltransferase
MADPLGDSSSFDQNWRTMQEANYLHWTREGPVNQIQLAFRQHWLTFQQLLGQDFSGNRVLEVGCGRGSLSAYFADAGWDCTLLDLSPAVLEVAENAFSANGLKAKFDVGDCLSLPYDDDSFDLAFSIGLLEHFEDIDRVIAEQYRILAPGGKFIGYVVPHIPENVQVEYSWVCDLLKTLVPTSQGIEKTPVYRSDVLSPPYLESMQQVGFKDMGASGTYPLPMISHSIDFPFTLLPPNAEAVLVNQFMEILDKRKKEFPGINPWLCDEGYGQAFLVWGTKS